MVEVMEEEFVEILKQYDLWTIGRLYSKKFLISGGTGFIGSYLINVLRMMNDKYDLNMHVYSLSRRGGVDDDFVTYIRQDICEPFETTKHIDYVIHLASNTHPEQYGNEPVGTITTNIMGCINLLDFCDRHRCLFLLASSVEIYGQSDDEELTEEDCGWINCYNYRSGYNEAKRVCESLCASYKKQYDVNSEIVRLARVFGPDKTKNDTKAMAQFINKAVNGEDIVLHSAGDQKYSYCYVADAVNGILRVLLSGEPNEVYNLAEDHYGYSLKDYAEYIASLSGNKVIFDIVDTPNASKAKNAVLNIDKIKSIGYYPIYTVKEGLKRTYEQLSKS